MNYIMSCQREREREQERDNEKGGRKKERVEEGEVRKGKKKISSLVHLNTTISFIIKVYH